MHTINLIGEINEDMVRKVAEELDECVGEPVHIRLCSEGGSAYDAIAIAGMVANYTAEVTVTVYGKAMSAAIIIVAAGDIRKAVPGSWFMVHEDSGKTKGSTTEITAYAGQMQAEEASWNSLLAQWTKTDTATWNNMAVKTTYFSAQTARELGLIDHILN